MKFTIVRKTITEKMASKVGTIERNANGTAKSSSVREICARALTKSEWEDKVRIRKREVIKEQRVLGHALTHTLFAFRMSSWM